MKFDFVCGNPPYQIVEESDNKGFAAPIYHKFMDEAYKVADHVILIHPARFLFNAGSTPKEWNKKILNDPHFKVMQFEHDASTVFQNTEIKGGIAITYRDGKKIFDAVGMFIPHEKLQSIFKKTSEYHGFESLSSIMENQTRFNLEAMYADYPSLRKVIGSNGKDRRFRNNIFDKVALFTDNPPRKPNIAVLGVVNNKRTVKYFPIKYVDQENSNLSCWKVIVARVNGAGAVGELLSTPVILGPNEGYTQTFIGIGRFASKKEAENALKYIKTKFARTLLGILKITQDNSIEVWQPIPLQNFSDNSDIDWTKSVKQIDQQLYKKYGLDQTEIEFIESHAKEME